MGNDSISRRDLFSGLRGQAAPLRPPFALPEAVFIDKCTGCGDCVGSCPKNILVRGRGGCPQVDFAKGGCDFCGRCADICKTGAFMATREANKAWPVRAVVGAGCLEHRGISCRACEAWCEERAIRFRPALHGRTDILLDSEICTGCGACVARCPQDAIQIARAKRPEPQTTPEKTPEKTEEVA